jgi:hypothetical protein
VNFAWPGFLLEAGSFRSLRSVERTSRIVVIDYA